MTDDPARGNASTDWRLRQLEEWRRDVDREGTPGLRVTQVQVDVLKERISALERAYAWAVRSVILVTATGVVALFVWLIQGGGQPT